MSYANADGAGETALLVKIMHYTEADMIDPARAASRTLSLTRGYRARRLRRRRPWPMPHHAPTGSAGSRVGKCILGREQNSSHDVLEHHSCWPDAKHHSATTRRVSSPSSSLRNQLRPARCRHAIRPNARNLSKAKCEDLSRHVPSLPGLIGLAGS